MFVPSLAIHSSDRMTRMTRRETRKARKRKSVIGKASQEALLRHLMLW